MTRQQHRVADREKIVSREKGYSNIIRLSRLVRSHLAATGLHSGCIILPAVELLLDVFRLMVVLVCIFREF